MHHGSVKNSEECEKKFKLTESAQWELVQDCKEWHQPAYSPSTIGSLSVIFEQDSGDYNNGMIG